MEFFKMICLLWILPFGTLFIVSYLVRKGNKKEVYREYLDKNVNEGTFELKHKYNKLTIFLSRPRWHEQEGGSITIINSNNDTIDSKISATHSDTLEIKDPKFTMPGKYKFVAKTEDCSNVYLLIQGIKFNVALILVIMAWIAMGAVWGGAVGGIFKLF